MEQVKHDGVRGAPLRRPQANEYALLPAEAPLDMPVQPLALAAGRDDAEADPEVDPLVDPHVDAHVDPLAKPQADHQADHLADHLADQRADPLPKPRAHARRTRDRMTSSRAALFALSGGAVAVYAHTLYQVLSVVQLTVLQGVFLVLCTLCFAWIAVGTCSAILGFFGIPLPAESKPETRAQGEPHRTALLFPVHQEDAARIAATIEAIAKELIALGCEQKFDVFMLSDSRLGDCKARELRAVRFLRRRLKGRMRIYYRARSDNVGKKAGNIADWVRRFGGAYQSFVILDADSIMSGALLVQLQREMAGRPNCALLQTVPRLVGARTLFARLQQFAVAFYGPVVAAGFAVWHRNSGNYWGHNAIVRTLAFARAAGLPDLPGRAPFGGHVQSHDFVEAAFLRRAGWDVAMLPELRGSYEGCPPTLIDVAVRDRRWAQGNLQHLRIVAARGLPLVSRLHLIMGAYAYLASALWALSLVVGIVLAVESAYTLPVYFPQTKTLFPIWPVIDSTKALYLFLGTIVVLLLPKMLGICRALARRDASARPPLGTFLAGACLEMLFSILIAPILMLTQTRAVVEILRGRDAGWSAQRRDGEGPARREMLRFHYGHTLCGAALAIVCALASGYVLAWMAPIVLGLLLSAAISRFSSRVAPDWAARALATPEDFAPPEIVRAADAAYPEWAAMLARRPAPA